MVWRIAFPHKRGREANEDTKLPVEKIKSGEVVKDNHNVLKARLRVVCSPTTATTSRSFPLSGATSTRRMLPRHCEFTADGWRRGEKKNKQSKRARLSKF